MARQSAVDRNAEKIEKLVRECEVLRAEKTMLKSTVQTAQYEIHKIGIERQHAQTEAARLRESLRKAEASINGWIGFVQGVCAANNIPIADKIYQRTERCLIHIEDEEGS